METERQRIIDPIVPESIGHNTRVLSNIRALTGFLFGAAAGVLGLQSYPGFLFYLLGSLVVSSFVYTLLAKNQPGRYWQSGSQVWYSEVFGGLSGFVLTWTLFFGTIRV
jgi:hypothetical protein